MWKRVAVLGAGLMGGSVAKATRTRHLAETVVVFDTQPEAARTAVSLGAADLASPTEAEALHNADLVILAMPVPAILTAIPRLAPLLASHTLVTDLGSVKTPITIAASQALPPDTFIGGHPMAGGENGGIAHARADLFENAFWFLTPTTPPSENVVRLTRYLEALGAKVRLVSPTEHDHAVALTSHLPHVLAYTLFAQAAATPPPVQDFTAGSFASATRVAASPPALWQGITLANRDALLETLHAFRARLDTTIDALTHSDADALLSQFNAGHRSIE